MSSAASTVAATLAPDKAPRLRAAARHHLPALGQALHLRGLRGRIAPRFIEQAGAPIVFLTIYLDEESDHLSRDITKARATAFELCVFLGFVVHHMLLAGGPAGAVGLKLSSYHGSRAFEAA